MSQLNVEQWKEMFQEIGLTEADMLKWHRLFETKNPQAHQAFLEWLGVDAATISKIREKSK